MNLLDLILILLITAVVVLALGKIIRDRKKGKICHGCTGQCPGCSLVSGQAEVPSQTLLRSTRKKP